MCAKRFIKHGVQSPRCTLIGRIKQFTCCKTASTKKPLICFLLIIIYSSAIAKSDQIITYIVKSSPIYFAVVCLLLLMPTMYEQKIQIQSQIQSCNSVSWKLIRSHYQYGIGIESNEPCNKFSSTVFVDKRSSPIKPFDDFSKKSPEIIVSIIWCQGLI